MFSTPKSEKCRYKILRYCCTFSPCQWQMMAHNSSGQRLTLMCPAHSSTWTTISSHHRSCKHVILAVDSSTNWCDNYSRQTCSWTNVKLGLAWWAHGTDDQNMLCRPSSVSKPSEAVWRNVQPRLCAAGMHAWRACTSPMANLTRVQNHSLSLLVHDCAALPPGQLIELARAGSAPFRG